MKLLNKIIFYGLLVSGFALAIVFLFGIADVSLPSLLGVILANIAITGWFFGVASVISFLVATFLYVAGKVTDYWSSLYPVNFGLTLLGGTSLGYNTEMSVLWILVACAGAFVVSLVAYKSHVIKSKWIFVPLIAPLFFANVVFWTTLIIGLVFISLSLLSRVGDNGSLIAQTR